MTSEGLTLAGISGWGGAALVSGPGDVVQAASATADSTIAVAGQPKFRFPIGHLSSTSARSIRCQIRQACGQTDPPVTVAWLTRRQAGLKAPIRPPDPGNFGVRIGRGQGGCEAALCQTGGIRTLRSA